MKKKSWISDILADLIVTAIIAAAAFSGNPWLSYIVIGYTGFILAVKLLVLLSGQLQAITGRSRSSAPDVIYHVLYSLNVFLLVLFGWYITALIWTVIWGISVYHTRKSKRPVEIVN